MGFVSERPLPAPTSMEISSSLYWIAPTPLLRYTRLLRLRPSLKAAPYRACAPRGLALPGAGIVESTLSPGGLKRVQSRFESQGSQRITCLSGVPVSSQEFGRHCPPFRLLRSGLETGRTWTDWYEQGCRPDRVR